MLHIVESNKKLPNYRRMSKASLHLGRRGHHQSRCSSSLSIRKAGPNWAVAVCRAVPAHAPKAAVVNDEEAPGVQHRREAT